MYKTSTNWFTAPHCYMCITLIEINKQISLQVRLLPGIYLYTLLKVIVRKQIQILSEIRDFIKALCMFGLSIRNIHDEICVSYGDTQVSFSTVFNINKIKSVIEKDALSLSDS